MNLLFAIRYVGRAKADEVQRKNIEVVYNQQVEFHLQLGSSIVTTISVTLSRRLPPIYRIRTTRRCWSVDMELAELSFPYDVSLHLSRFESRKAVVLKIHLVWEIKVTGFRFINRRWLTRTPPTAVVNCGTPVAAVHAGLLTCIYTRNGFREITNACPSPSVLALNTSENVTSCIKFASVRRQYQWHQNGTWDFLPAPHPMRCVLADNGANVWLQPVVRHGLTWPRDTTQTKCDLSQSESLFKKENVGELQ